MLKKTKMMAKLIPLPMRMTKQLQMIVREIDKARAEAKAEAEIDKADELEAVQAEVPAGQPSGVWSRAPDPAEAGR